MDTNLVALVLASGIVAAIAVVAVIWYVLLVIANWKIFQKFGEPGWKSIIPVYNSYILFKYTWNIRMFAIYMLFCILFGAISNIDYSSGIVMVIALVVSIVFAVLNIKHYHKISKAFGHGTAFTVGLILVNNIFMLILGFGRSEYIGNSNDMI